MCVSYSKVQCSNPHCGHVTVVKEREATFDEPSDVDREDCAKCGDDLDWDSAQSTSLDDLRWEMDPRV